MEAQSHNRSDHHHHHHHCPPCCLITKQNSLDLLLWIAGEDRLISPAALSICSQHLLGSQHPWQLLEPRTVLVMSWSAGQRMRASWPSLQTLAGVGSQWGGQALLLLTRRSNKRCTQYVMHAGGSHWPAVEVRNPKWGRSIWAAWKDGES